MGQMEQIFINYINGLDWPYIFSFLIIGYAINTEMAKHTLKKVIGTCAKTRYRIALLGLLYGTLLFYLRGMLLSDIEPLLHSFVFAIVFHKLILDSLVAYFKNKYTRFISKLDDEDKCK